MSRRYTLGILPLFKHCPKCLRWLGHTEFWKTQSTPDGLRHACKECMNTETSERLYRRSLTCAERDPWDSGECSKCRRTLPAERFSPNRNRRSGLHGHCKSCVNARQREKRAERKA